jgi:hypothetical protein
MSSPVCQSTHLLGYIKICLPLTAHVYNVGIER